MPHLIPWGERFDIDVGIEGGWLAQGQISASGNQVCFGLGAAFHEALCFGRSAFAMGDFYRASSHVALKIDVANMAQIGSFVYP